MNLLSFLDSSPCNFFAVKTAAEHLEEAGFTRLDAKEQWSLKRGGKYYITKNDSAIFAFIVGTGVPEKGWRIISSHSDSPGFRIKPNPEMRSHGNIVKLNTEVYGGPILYTWFDRPLSIAGRVILKSDPLNPETRLVRFNEPLLTIPHLAIHFNRGVNEGNHLSKQKDMLPVLAKIDELASQENLLLHLVSKQLGVNPKEIMDFDLTLYDTTPACHIGIEKEFVSSGRIDDLMMVCASLDALIESSRKPSEVTRLIAVFDNEETGSGTKQGAASPVLHNLLQRLNLALGGDQETFLRAIDSSFMISADNAHGIHPNYAEKHDPTNHPVLGGGPVIKINANCKYMTDARSASVFMAICEEAGVPYQQFVNHSDVAGGSTLGNILTSQIDLQGVDMGAPQWAMHSCRETAATIDYDYTTRAFTTFYNLPV